jgi:hypothetical protein
MVNTLEAHEEYYDMVKCCIFLDDGERGGLVLHGYDNDSEAIVDLFAHLRAIFRANGGDLSIVPMVGHG